MPEVPKLLGGRYEVGELLGRGGMAEVHLGHDSRLGRPVAIKMLRSDLARDQTFISRFRREAQSAAGLNHASIVAVYDHGEDTAVEAGGASIRVPFIVMEYVDGRTLRQVITERGTIPPEEALRITEGVLDALGYSHRNGIVHRDIKPANVMIGEDGTVKVMDFGIARAMADANATMTQTQAVIGTAQYLSPEQAQGQTVDARSDLYSTGCLLFELLTGRPPFLGESPVSIAYQHVGEPPTAPSRYVDGLTDDLDAVVLHSLAKPREARYQSAAEFRSDLRAVRLGRPVSDVARGSATALAGAAAGGVLLGAGATEAMPFGAEATRAYAPGVVELPAGPGTDVFPPVGREDEKRRNPALWVLLALAVLAAIAALGYGLFAGFGQPDVPRVSVPRVTGLPEQTAVANLARAKLTSTSVPAPSDTVPEGDVISQDPGAGTMVAERTQVGLTVSSGPSAVTVPDVSGKPLTEAKALLEDLGLRVGTPQQVDDPSTKKDVVLDSNPGAGASVPPNSAIQLRVGTGKVAVPNVVGKSTDEAQRLLNAAGLESRTQFRQSSSVRQGDVIEQDPRDGKVGIGSTVTIVIAQKPAPTVTATPTPPPTPTPSPSPSPSASPSPSPTPGGTSSSSPTPPPTP